LPKRASRDSSSPKSTSSRTRARAGADIHAAAQPGGPTPLSRARELEAAGEAKEGTAAFLILEAAKPWSKKTHHLFGPKARARAVELMRPGELLAREARFGNEGRAMHDVWFAVVMAHAVVRELDLE